MTDVNTVARRAWSLVRRRVARPLLHGARRPVLMRRMARAASVKVLGLTLRTEPGVFHPVYFSSSTLLASHLLERPLRGRALLDMGTGSGIIGIATAVAGATVTSCDVNPKAVALARANAASNGLDVEVLESDLFAGLDGRVFDVIAFNIPFYPTEATTPYEKAFRAGAGLSTVDRFAAGSSSHLRAGGEVVIVFSEDCDRRVILGHFERAGFALRDERRRRELLEVFVVATFARR